MYKVTTKFILAIILFLLGLYVVLTYKSDDVIESFSGNRCPDMLIQKGDKIFLYNSKLDEVPGVNPIQFDNLEEYSEFIEWQRSHNIRCPLLFLQQSYDVQGKSVYKIKDPNNLQNNLPSELIKPKKSEMQLNSKLLDSNHDDKPFNQNSYPGYDSQNQYIGLNTPLDKLYSMDEVTRKYSPNAMMSNWGGVKYSDKTVEQEVIDKTVNEQIYQKNNR
uniref:Uncharacterized protein n=1 Tax=viral metagenome TaxID=1070528 RepID=A0A6C0BTE4_9ZZZZ